MAGREVREYTNLTDPKDRKSGKGKDKIDDEEVTFQRMVAKVEQNLGKWTSKQAFGFEGPWSWKNFLSNFWQASQPVFSDSVTDDIGSNIVEHGFCWAVDVNRCRKLLVIVGDIFMGEAVRVFLPEKALSRRACVEFMNTLFAALDSDDLLYLKEQMEAEEDAERLLRRTEKRAFAAFKKAASAADTSPAPLPLPLRVEPKPKSGIRQQDLLKNIVEIRPKRHRVSSPSDAVQESHPSARPENAAPKDAKLGQKIPRSVLTSEPSGAAKNEARGLLGLAYESSDED